MISGGRVIDAGSGGPPALAGPIDLDRPMTPVLESEEGEQPPAAPESELEAPAKNQGDAPEANAPGASKPFSRMSTEEQTEYASSVEEDRRLAQAEKETPAPAAPVQKKPRDPQASLLDQ